MIAVLVFTRHDLSLCILRCRHVLTEGAFYTQSPEIMEPQDGDIPEPEVVPGDNGELQLPPAYLEAVRAVERQRAEQEQLARQAAQQVSDCLMRVSPGSEDATPVPPLAVSPVSRWMLCRTSVAVGCCIHGTVQIRLCRLIDACCMRTGVPCCCRSTLGHT